MEPARSRRPWIADANQHNHVAYNKWHETELERWLSDHDIPYPTPADRKYLEKLIQKNWDTYAVTPYQKWDTDQLLAYLKLKGVDTKEAADKDKNALVSQVRNVWFETEDKAQNAWSSVSDWILDSWTESQLKAFCDYHGIPGMCSERTSSWRVSRLPTVVPQPRRRDTLLEKARASYESLAQKAGEAAAYPGNWLYQSWSGKSAVTHPAVVAAVDREQNPTLRNGLTPMGSQLPSQPQYVSCSPRITHC